MVADPPKIAWTNDYLVDYLLTGSKQRLHVTLLNGPGAITEGSILRISSKSGLLFYSLNASSIQVFPLERDGIPREAAVSVDVGSADYDIVAMVHLPACKPYERVNIYFDVVAPVHRNAGDSSMTQHEINFSCLWLENLVNSLLRLDCTFYEPFQVKHKTVHTSTSTFVKVTLCGVNPVPLLFSSPKLELTDNQDVSFNMMSPSSELRVFGTEECSLLWKLYHRGEKNPEKNSFNCVFKVEFKTKDDEDYDLGSFKKIISINVQQYIYSVEVSMPSERLEKSKPCLVTINVTNKYHTNTVTYRLFLMLNPTDATWRCVTKGKVFEIKFEDGSVASEQIEVVTDRSGMVPVPLFTLFKSHKMEGDHNVDILELLSQLQRGEVEYVSSSQMTMCYDSSVGSTVVTQV